MKMFSTLSVAFAALVMVVAPASAQSSKAAWNYNHLVPLGTAAAQTPGGTPTGDTGWVSILKTYLKTPNGKEIAIGVSLQCGLLTDTTVRSKNGQEDTAASQGRIKVRVKITQPNGAVVYAQPENGHDLGDVILAAGPGLTYCDRFQKLAGTFSGLNCRIDTTDADGDGNTTELICDDPESLQLVLKTLNAAHFNFIHANAIPGVHTIEVEARAEAGVVLGGTQLGAAKAEAFAGAGVISAETIRLVKDEDGVGPPVEIN